MWRSCAILSVPIVFLLGREALQKRPAEKPDELDEDTKIIAELVSKLTPEQLDPALYIAQNMDKFTPEHCLAEVVKHMIK